MAGPSVDPETGWAEQSRCFAELVTEYHRVRGRSSDEPAVASTVRTNTELVPRRAQNLAQLWEKLGDGFPMTGRVLEVGCGFGALAAYIALHGGVKSVVGIDSRFDFIRDAEMCASRLGVADRLQYVHCDMRALQRVGHEPFDLAILNNSFIYLPTRKDMVGALRELHAILRPGGGVLFFHANRWQLREPFTRAPAVHLLPPRAATLVAGATGWSHNVGRVRLVSAPALAHMLRRAGFETPRPGALKHGQVETGVRAALSRFYAMAARRP